MQSGLLKDLLVRGLPGSTRQWARLTAGILMGGVCLGVLAAYSVHVQCTIPNATLPCDELPFVRVDDVLGGSLVLEEGHFRVPEGPGLGVKLDMMVVEKYRVA